MLLRDCNRINSFLVTLIFCLVFVLRRVLCASCYNDADIFREKEESVFLISVIFHIRRIPCLLKPSLQTSASPYFDSV